MSDYEMNEEQQALFDALSTLMRKKFALGVVAGKSLIQSYLDAGGKATGTAAYTGASDLHAEPSIQAFLKAMNAPLVSAAIMSREEALEKLTAFARTGISELVDFGEYNLGEDEDGNPIVQSSWRIKPQTLQDPMKMAVISELTAGRDGIKLKTHSPLQAIQQLAKMQGWDAPQKTELTGKDGGPIHVVNLEDLTDEQLAAIASEE